MSSDRLLVAAATHAIEVISSGYRIGPFEVESALGEHPAVAEAAVVPKPDDERGNVVCSAVERIDFSSGLVDILGMSEKEQV